MATTAPKHDVRDLGLAGAGQGRIDWAYREMPVLRSVRERFAIEQPLAGIRVAACLHVTAETANLVLTLAAGGAEVVLCAADQSSTQDDVAAALVAEHGVPVFAIWDEDDETFFRHVNAAADHRPQLTLDDGGDIVGVLHATRRRQLSDVIAGTEATAAGILRLRAMEREGVLGFPIIAVNEAQTKSLFDNRYGTGQSTVDGIVRSTNALLAGSTFVVGGYGWCGRGIAERARGMGALVVVLEVDPLRALQAAMDGFRVLPIAEAAPIGDIFVTATGVKNVLRVEHFAVMKDGAILANAGHFNVEIDIPGLRSLAVSTHEPRTSVEQIHLADGRRLNLLAGGRLVNLAAAEGHPPSVMDLSFANQALAAEFAVRSADRLEARVYVVPEEIDREIARVKLQTLGITCDTLTDEQSRYLARWT